MPSENRVEEIVRSAWGRRLMVVAVERIAIAAAAVLGFLIVMFLTGTQVLDWRWLAAPLIVGLGIVAYQVRQRIVEHYRVAQLLDRRLRLADSLSTAWYLLTTPDRPRDAISEFQLRGAEIAARNIDLAEAFPFTGKRLWMMAGGLALLAAGLFCVRYLVTDSLSLRASLIPLRFGEVIERTDKDSDETKRQREEAQGSDRRGHKSTPKADGEKDGREPSRVDPPAVGRSDASQQGQNPSDPDQLREAKDGQGKEGQERRDAGSSQQRDGEKQGEQGDPSTASQKASSEDRANSPRSSNGLIDRMKDALSSLAAKVRPNAQSQQDSNQRSAGDKKGDQQGASKEENSASRQNTDNQDSSEQQQAANGQAQGQTQEKTRSGQGKTADQFADKSKSDSHSGIGSQDGDKEMKETDQLKAMGKLAEIIGKRSASATGDVMVENPSGKQHLETDYSGRLAQHADSGGEINRDEIPLMYQQYVREYMSQVRRQATQHPR